MKQLFTITFILLILNSCTRDKNPLTTGVYEGFAIYVLADSTVTATDAAQKPINTLTLANAQTITDEDLNYYQWNEHSLALKSEANEKIAKIAKSRQTVSGVPFVIVAKKEKIYLGAFWYAFSSIAPSFPTIEISSYLLEDIKSNVLKIEKSWIEDQPDVRGDTRIYQALLEADVLIP